MSHATTAMRGGLCAGALSARRNEDFHNVENVLRYPQQLDDMPQWRERINDAICIRPLTQDLALAR